MVLDELREAILLAEEAYHGISDSLVAHMVHRLQRYGPAARHTGHTVAVALYCLIHRRTVYC